MLWNIHGLEIMHAFCLKTAILPGGGVARDNFVCHTEYDAYQKKCMNLISLNFPGRGGGTWYVVRVKHVFKKNPHIYFIQYWSSVFAFEWNW